MLVSSHLDYYEVEHGPHVRELLENTKLHHPSAGALLAEGVAVLAPRTEEDDR